MCPYDKEIKKIKNQIIEKFQPKDIILFGSCAKGVVTKRSDIDICVIKNTDNKRKLVQDILVEVDYDIDLDVVVYTEKEWYKYKDDKSTFAYIIYSTGVSIIG